MSHMVPLVCAECASTSLPGLVQMTDFSAGGDRHSELRDSVEGCSSCSALFLSCLRRLPAEQGLSRALGGGCCCGPGRAVVLAGALLARTLVALDGLLLGGSGGSWVRSS